MCGGFGGPGTETKKNKKIRNRGDHQDLIGGRRLLVLKEDVDHIRGGYSLH